jgi:hypothetical protein
MLPISLVMRSAVQVILATAFRSAVITMLLSIADSFRSIHLTDGSTHVATQPLI